jgi:hypothetical protein
MKSDVSLFHVALVVSLKQEGLDLEKLDETLGKVFGADNVDRLADSVVVTAYPKGAQLSHFVKTKTRLITEIVAAAERRAQRKIAHAKRESQAKPDPEREGDAVAGA